MNATEKAWQTVMDALSDLYAYQTQINMQHHCGDELEISSDDEGMRNTSDDDLCMWADDLEARVGWDVTDFRAAIIDFCEVRAQQRLTDAGYTCDNSPRDDVLVNGEVWDCFIDAAHKLLDNTGAASNED